MTFRSLVIDDDAFIRTMLSRLLERRGHEVFAFSDPACCPLFTGGACACPPDTACADMVLCDRKITGSSGLDWIRRLKAFGCPIRHIALMSGEWPEAEACQAEAAGCRLLHKPFAIAEINNWMDACERDIAPGRRLADVFCGDRPPERQARE